MGGSTRCTALTLGAKALKSPVVPSEGLPHKKSPPGVNRRPLVRTCQSKGKATTGTKR